MRINAGLGGTSRHKRGPTPQLPKGGYTLMLRANDEPWLAHVG